MNFLSKINYISTCGLILTSGYLFAQSSTGPAFSRADSLRGTLNEKRTWWDVKRYDLEVEPDFENKTLKGRNTIKFSGNAGRLMQIDLQQPMVVDSILFQGNKLPFTREGNTAMIEFPAFLQTSGRQDFFLSIYYHGKPREAKRPPWDGGWIWSRDEEGRPWMSVACQGLGASVWYPCKDHQSDEPDEGASLTIITPQNLMGVGNGKHISTIEHGGKAIHRWEVRNPINAYNIVPYIGAYENFEEVFQGEEGNLNLSYWVLDYNLAKAKEQFRQVRPMLKCFEFWLGPYPFYEDDFKMVESPHLGMEHQSNIAYGNKFMNGYMGRDLSGTGWGNEWDFIIIHESGHEWFGNNITTNDIADMWVHEGFTNYTEVLFTQCKSGLDAANAYAQGIRRNIVNDRPVIGPYGVNKGGSGDMYYKGSNMIHTLRTMMQNDSLFRQMLRGLNKVFYHQTVTTQQVEKYIMEISGFGSKLQPFFDQYLRDIKIPVVEWKIKSGQLSARITNGVPGLTMRIWMPSDQGKGQWMWITKEWTTIPTQLNEVACETEWNPNLYVMYKAVNP
ncbi:MAG: M1 family metallopeptidase [Chitinophagaceae bacterium]|nr:M1 family metallopeptidase [Chitinophagaceae bacterium]